MSKRFAPRLLGLMGALCLLFPGLLMAQDPVPDTLDWRRYFPLEIGNQWQFQLFEPFLNPAGYLELVILRDTLIQDRYYFVVDRRTYDIDRQLTHSFEKPLRYDTTDSSIKWIGQLSDQTYVERDWDEAPCGLNAPFNSVIECGTPSPSPVFVDGFYDVEVIIGADTLAFDAYKTFERQVLFDQLVADVGLIRRDVEGGSGHILVYARVGDRVYGVPAIPTARETPPGLPERWSIEAVYPNPFRSVATVAYRLHTSDQVRAEVYNVGGQRLRSLELGYQPAGEHQFVLDGTDLSTGMYFLRLIAGSGKRADISFVRR